MPAVKPESPLVMEEVLLRWGYQVHYKDEFVCVVESRTNPRERPICIPQDVDELGGISLDCMQQILIDAKLDLFNYFVILKQVKGVDQDKKK